MWVGRAISGGSDWGEGRGGQWRFCDHVIRDEVEHPPALSLAYRADRLNRSPRSAFTVSHMLIRLREQLGAVVVTVAY